MLVYREVGGAVRMLIRTTTSIVGEKPVGTEGMYFVYKVEPSEMQIGWYTLISRKSIFRSYIHYWRLDVIKTTTGEIQMILN